MRLLRVIRRWRSYPFLLIPLQRGPLHGFYHFFIGYFLPAAHFALKYPKRQFAVVDSTPLNQWFELLPRQPMEIVSRDKAVKVAYLSRISHFSRGFRTTGFTGWDKGEKFRQRGFQELHENLNRHLAAQTKDVETRRPKILIMGRDYTPEHYANFLPTRYGAVKRNIPNLREVAEEIEKSFDSEFVDAATISPLEMVAKCQTASVIVAQHGAALTNLFFLPKESHVIEIGWPELFDETHLDMYRLLSNELCMKWRRPILQSDRFAPIGATELVTVLDEAINPGQTKK